MSSLHLEYFVQSVKILQKYSLASMVDTIPIENINNLIRTHQAQLRECDSFEKGKLMANKLMTDMSGFTLRIDDFISSEQDLRTLYKLVIAWRDSVLSPSV